MKRGTSGFTLVELCIVMAIVGYLAAIAIPMFSDLIAKSKEGNTKGNLGAIRSAMSIYYADNNGVYPSPADSQLNSLTTSGRYLLTIPPALFPLTFNSSGHPSSNFVAQVQFAPGGSMGAAVNTLDLGGQGGGWTYNVSAFYVGQSQTMGDVMPTCAHQDVRGFSWTTY